MIKATYPQMVKRICAAANLTEEEVERRVLEKKSKLSDLISKEGAAQIVAAELGVDFDGQRVKINELMSGMRRLSMVAKVTKMFPSREFKTKNGVDSKVMNMYIADETLSTKCVLWDVNQIKQFEEGKIKEGDVVEIKDASVRENNQALEIHVGSMSEIKLSTEKIENIVEMKSAPEVKLAMIAENARANARAVIVQVFEPRFFNVCPECGKKVNLDGDKFNCQTHGPVIPLERSLITLTIDDGTANIRAVGFTDVLKKLFSVDDSGIKSITPERRNSLLGKEMVFSGRGRKNPMYNNMEFLINDVEEVNVNKVIEDLGPK
ncbi:MAG: hypothetical protein KKE23_02820 [Nanoarchaeota archaeon]|nr:hypothetical protein [Nanoarchaeota archaeon]